MEMSNCCCGLLSLFSDAIKENTQASRIQCKLKVSISWQNYCHSSHYMDKTVNDNAKFVNYCGDHSSFPHYGAELFMEKPYSSSSPSWHLDCKCPLTWSKLFEDSDVWSNIVEWQSVFSSSSGDPACWILKGFCGIVNGWKGPTIFQWHKRMTKTDFS